MADCVTTDRISKQFGEVRAVDEISLHVVEGEIYGFLGANGAGKTTTIRMLLGMIRPTSGSAYLFGRRVHADRRGIWDKVGYLVEIPYSYPDLTVRENLEIIRRLRHIPGPACVDSIMEKLNLTQYHARLARHLSLGNAQRLGLAKALIHDPRILILDEPANGLDPAGIVEIRTLLQDLAARKGVTVFISSHILGEISKFANRVGIVHAGRLIEEVDTHRLDELRRRRLVVGARNNPAAQRILEQHGYEVEDRPDGELFSVSGHGAIESPERIAELLVAAHCPPTTLRVDEEDLESYFLRVTGAAGGRPS